MPARPLPRTDTSGPATSWAAPSGITSPLCQGHDEALRQGHLFSIILSAVTSRGEGTGSLSTELA